MENKPYNAKLLGQILNLGADHLVRRYGENEVIKFPVGLRYRLHPVQWCANLRRDKEILSQYFPEYLSNAQINFFTQKKPSYVVIEPYYQGRHLRRSDLNDKNIFRQFAEIVRQNKHMMAAENLALDFFGIRGLLWKGRREVCNIMLETKTRRLKIIDVAALHFGRTRDQQILVSFFTNLGLYIQDKLLKLYRAV